MYAKYHMKQYLKKQQVVKSESNDKSWTSNLITLSELILLTKSKLNTFNNNKKSEGNCTIRSCFIYYHYAFYNTCVLAFKSFKIKLKKKFIVRFV